MKKTKDREQDKALSRTMRRSFGFSLAIHLLLVASLIGRLPGCGSGNGEEGGGKEQQQAEGDPDTREIISKPNDQPVEVELVTLPPKTKEELALEKLEEQRRKEMENCEPFFGGVGITQVYDFDHGPIKILVGEVHHGYPAEQVGIQVGDEIINSGELRGEVGTEVQIHVRRQGVEMTFITRRGRICVQDVKGDTNGLEP